MAISLWFLHGFMGHPCDWDALRASLEPHPSHAIQLPVSESWSFSIEALAEMIPESSVLIGYSMGARLALGLALEYPTRYRGLIFVSGNPGLESAADRASRYDADFRIAEELETLQTLGTESLEAFLNRWYQSEVFASLAREQRVEQIAAKLSQAAGGILEWPAIMRANSVSQQPNYWPRLPSLEIPTLAVAGELDPKYRSITARIGEEAPQVTTHLVPNSGHIVQRENPDYLSALIRDFYVTRLSES